MTKLFAVDASRVNPLTWEVFYGHYLTQGWAHNQLWAWEGGDAVVAVCGPISNSYVAVCVRRGVRVDVVLAQGLMEALERLGENRADFVVA